VKKFLLVFAILTVIAYKYEHGDFRRLAEDPLNPETISNPVYAQLKVGLETGGRSYDQVILVKTVDQSDCGKVQQQLENVYGPAETAKVHQSWNIKSSECKADLEPRYLKLFDNRPMSVTYLSLGRGDLKERESRMVVWGVSVDESNILCDGVAKNQKNRKGIVQCIRAVQTES